MQNKQRVDGKTAVKRLSRRSTWVFILLALIAVIAYFLLAGETTDERASAAEINLAGKRRMLSQRIGLLSSQFLHEQKTGDLAELGKALKQMAIFHDTLRHGDPEQGIRAPHTAKLRASYEAPGGMDELMRHYLAQGNALLAAANAGNDYQASARQLIDISQGLFLEALDHQVGEYQTESENSSDTQQLLQWCALLAALGLLAFSALGVLKPLIMQLTSALDEQDASESALRKAVEENQLILQTAGDGIFGVDRSGQISFANQAAVDMLGATGISLLDSMNHHEIMATGAGCPICRVLNNGEAFQLADGRFHRLGDIGLTGIDPGFPVEYSVTARPDGEGAVVSFRDISERWQAELKLQRFQQRLVDAIEALDDAFALFDADDRLSLYNLRFTEVFPLRGKVISIGMPFTTFVRAVADQQLYAITADRLEDWVAERMAVHRRAEGSSEIPLSDGRWLRATERRTREEGTVVIWSDVSHLKNALIAADHASQAKSEFMARMSHELRTPLNAILGFAQVLKQGLEAPSPLRQSECVSHILQGGHHLLNLINEILDLSAIEAGRLSIEMEDLALSPLIRECEALVSPQAVDRHVTLRCGNSGLLSVRGDGLRLKQVLLNFLSNGIKYNRVGGQLTLSIIENPTFVRLTVEDTGQGIPPDLASRVFQPFERLGANGVEGTGIGLSITQRLVVLMGGRIGFDSTVGVGSRFWVELEKVSGSGINGFAQAPQPVCLPLVTEDIALKTQDDRLLLAIGLPPADRELLQLICSTLRKTRLEFTASLGESEDLLAGKAYHGMIIDSSLADDFLHARRQHVNSPSLVIGLYTKPGIPLPDTAKISHWQPKPLRPREMARLLRETLP